MVVVGDVISENGFVLDKVVQGDGFEMVVMCDDNGTGCGW